MLPDPLHPAVVHLPIALAILLPGLALLGAWAIRSKLVPPRTWVALLLLQASPSAAHHRLSRVLIEAGLLDGVIECRDQVTPRESEAACLAGLRSSHRRRCVVVL